MAVFSTNQIKVIRHWIANIKIVQIFYTNNTVLSFLNFFAQKGSFSLTRSAHIFVITCRLPRPPLRVSFSHIFNLGCFAFVPCTVHNCLDCVAECRSVRMPEKLLKSLAYILTNNTGSIRSAVVVEQLKMLSKSRDVGHRDKSCRADSY